jgi:hypothetical protein
MAVVDVFAVESASTLALSTFLNPIELLLDMLIERKRLVGC